MTGMTLAQAWPTLFTPQDAQLLSGKQDLVVPFRPREQILRSGKVADRLLFISRGFVGNYRTDRFGRRQFLSIQVPGDFVDLPGFLLGHRDMDAEALGPVELCALSPEHLQSLEAEAPAVDRKLWRISMIDAASGWHWIFRLGRLGGRARVASFFCDMLVRLYARGLCTFDGFDLPLTQTDLAEVSGMTPVHVSRMLSELREEGICAFAQGAVQILNLPALFQTGQYRWDHLYLGDDLDREIADKTGMRATPKRTHVAL